ncbi:hypothetical protein ACTFIR_011777 [Dictyostelium discoideum]
MIKNIIKITNNCNIRKNLFIENKNIFYNFNNNNKRFIHLKTTTEQFDDDLEPLYLDVDGIDINDSKVITITNGNNNNKKQIDKTIITTTTTTTTSELYGKKVSEDMETEFKPNLLKLLKDLNIKFSTTNDNDGDGGEIPKIIIDSLTHCPSLQNEADQNKLRFFGELCYRHSISDSEFSFDDQSIFEEFRESIKSSYFLRERCKDIGLSEFIRFQINPNSFYKSIYFSHYSYRCLIKFIGALYLETDFKTVRNFIHTQILRQPHQSLESFILNKPESILIKNFSNFKLEPPIIKTIPPKNDFPLYSTIIKTGSTEVSKAFGVSKDESYNYAIELLNSRSDSFSSLMSLLISKSNNNNNNNNNINNINNNNNNSHNNNNNKNNNNKNKNNNNLRKRK